MKNSYDTSCDRTSTLTTVLPGSPYRAGNPGNVKCLFKLLTPNVNYSGRTAPLNSKVAFHIFIQQIYVLNILNMVYTLRFLLFKMQFVS